MPIRSDHPRPFSNLLPPFSSSLPEMKTNYLSPVLIALFCGSVAFAETVAVESPDGHLKLTVEVADDGAL